jgi:hypothetical protein
MRKLLFVFATLALPVLCVASDMAQDRAHQLASDYFVRYFRIGCGGVGSPTFHGDHWEAPVHIGAAGTLSGYIHVDGHTGEVSYGRACAKFPVVSADSLEAWAVSLKKQTRKVLTNHWSQPLSGG